MPVWFKLDVHLPSNPKVKRAAKLAGVSAPMAYIALLAINKMHAFRGEVPADYGAPAELAEWWRMDSTEEMREGLRACRQEKLVAFTKTSIHIVGWGPEWDRQESAAERSRRYRAKKKASKESEESAPEESQEDGEPVTPSRDAVTHHRAALPSQRHEGSHRSEESRSEEIRTEENPPTPLTEGAPPAEQETKKAKAKTRKEKLLSEWGELAGELWDFQEMLRASAIPRSRPLQPDEERLARVCQRLAGGASREDCEEVLRAYARESKAKPENARHFNGVTNWRKDNFDRTLGGLGGNSHGDGTTGRAKPMARSEVQETGEQALR